MASVGALVAEQESTGRAVLWSKSTNCTDYSIKPEAKTTPPDTSTWPLLLKVRLHNKSSLVLMSQNYDKLLVRTGHFTPIPRYPVSDLRIELMMAAAVPPFDGLCKTISGN
jgi:hypothetical protein